MVRGLYSREATNQMSNETNKNEKSQKSSLIWNSEKKRPSNLAFILIIVLTIIFLISGVLSTLASFHEIKVVLESDGTYYGSINFQDTYNSIDRDTGLREYFYQVRIGVQVYVSIYHSNYQSSSSPLTIEIYDNGDLVADRTSSPSSTNVRLEYTVGDN